MKTKALNLLLPVLLTSVYYVTALAMAQAQGPPPPPPPAKDYFPDKWDEYSSQTGKFRIRFPKVPREVVSTQGQLEVHALQCKGLLYYHASSIDYKVPIDDPTKLKDFLQGLKTAALSSLRDGELRVVSERDIAVDDHRGIFLHIEVRGEEVIRMQWVAAGTRLYFVSASSRKGSPNEMEGKDDFEKVAMGFINSFHATP